MGLRTASVRHTHVAVMAPALTETTQSQNFKLPPGEPHSSSPTSNLHEHDSLYISSENSTHCKSDENLNTPLLNGKDLNYGFDNLTTLALASEILNIREGLGCPSEASENIFIPNQSAGTIMNNSPPPMGDQEDKMGLQKNALDAVSTVLKDKTASNDVDQFFGNLSSVLPAADICNTSDIVQNDDDIMQVIKSMEAGNERLSNPSSELGGEGDAMFALSSTDLTGNLSSFEKELLNDVDMMSIGMEEPFIDTATSLKESQTKEAISDLQKRRAKMARRLDFLYRRARKLQAQAMGQHFSGEVAGVFEFVHRTLRKLKENSSAHQAEMKLLEPSTSTSVPIVSSTNEPVLTEKLKPMSQASTKSLVRKLEMSLMVQTNAISRQRHAARYFGSGSVESGLYKNSSTTSSLPSWPVEVKHELQKVAGHLKSEFHLTQTEVDSEATASSSGGESCDEMQNYNNPYQNYLRIQKRAVWKYLTDRAAIAARWTWLQAQISDLEYRIRQHSELHRKIRVNKGAVILGGASPPHSVPTSPTSAVNGYRGQLPGSMPVSSKIPESTANGAVPSSCDFQSARTRPLVNFRKRKLLQTSGLHAVSKKAARPSTMRCGCVPPLVPCALCTGRTDPTHPRDLTESLNKPEKIALLDPSYHPVFSLPDDASAGIHFEAIMKLPEWQQKSTRSNIKLKPLTKPERLEKTNVPFDQRPKKLDHRNKKYSRLLKPNTVNALSAKIKNKLRGRRAGRHSHLNKITKKRNSSNDPTGQYQTSAGDSVDEDIEVIGINSSGNISKTDSPSSSPLLSVSGISRRSRINSYDIDNIVIPYSVAAATRVEKLQYKEILTPKWRLVDPDFAVKYDTKNNGIVKNTSQDSDAEDLSEEAVVIRHEKCEHEERKKFLSYLKLPIGYGRSRSNRRTDSRAESSGANTPDPLSPHNTDHLENTNSPITSPPATPLSSNVDDGQPYPSVGVLRKRTTSQTKWVKDKDNNKDDNIASNNTEQVDVIPYERRAFPLCEEIFENMLKCMPENHQFKTNSRSQDSREYVSPVSYFDDKLDSPDSESTESAIGEEDPNDPEWIDMEHVKDGKHKR